jgi:hypothetical protein
MAASVSAAVAGLAGITYRASRPVVVLAGDVWVEGSDVLVASSVNGAAGVSSATVAAVVAAVRGVPGYGGADVVTDDLKLSNRRVTATRVVAPVVLDNGDL